MINTNNVNRLLKKEIKDNKVLLAFSGGPDSTFLLKILSSYFKDKMKDRVILAYVNYHDSDFTYNEEKIVSYYTKKYNLTRYQLHTLFNEKEDHNFEEWAREKRYKFFLDICKIEKINYLLIAHHKDDLIETYLLQKERKILPRHYGLISSVNHKGINLIRPLLYFYKNEIKSYLEKNDYIYYDDITNYDTNKKRNEIRSSNLTITEKDKIAKLVESKNKNLRKLYKEFDKAPINNFSYYRELSEDNKKRYIFFLIDKLNLEIKQKEKYLHLIYDYLKNSNSGILYLDKEYKVYKSFSSFIISKGYKVKNYKYKIEKEGKYDLPYFEIDLSKPKLFNIKKFPIYIRNHLPDDKISTNLISKDVDNFIKKQKVPLYYRDIYPVLTDDEGNIFYVPFFVDIEKGKIPIYFHKL